VFKGTVMRHDRTRDGTEGGGVVGAPTQCPTCRSPAVKTTSKIVNNDSYWRCEACGEVWNVGRRRAAGRYSNTPSWDR
jgi:transposase-like protein